MTKQSFKKHSSEKSGTSFTIFVQLE